MKVEYINPFPGSTVDVFATMLKCKLVRGQPFIKNGAQPQFDISGIIGLSGCAKGTVVTQPVPRDALCATEAMVGQKPASIDADVRDAVGELTNIIAGSAKAKLEDLNLSVSLPSVITGKGHCIDFPKAVTPVCIPFDCPWGAVAVEIGLALA